VKHQLIPPHTTAVTVAQAGSGGFLQGALAFTARYWQVIQAGEEASIRMPSEGLASSSHEAETESDMPL